MQLRGQLHLPQLLELHLLLQRRKLRQPLLLLKLQRLQPVLHQRKLPM